MKMRCAILFALMPLLSIGGEGTTTNDVKKGSAVATSKPESGIRGVVVRWPIKPSSRAGETNSAPLPNVTVSVQPEKGGVEVARQKADENGRFEFRLPAGKYEIVPVLEPSLRFRIRKETVEVKEKKITEVVLICDTGIR
jgi:hypothetical protein